MRVQHWPAIAGHTAPAPVQLSHTQRFGFVWLNTDSGFADEATQAAKLMRVFRHFNTDKDGWISFEEFQAALVRLNFVGVQREVGVCSAAVILVSLGRTVAG